MVQFNGKTSINESLSKVNLKEVAFPDGSWYTLGNGFPQGAGGAGTYLRRGMKPEPVTVKARSAKLPR